MALGQTPSGQTSTARRGWNLTVRGTRRPSGRGRSRAAGTPGEALAQFRLGTQLAERLLGPSRAATLRPVPCLIPVASRTNRGRFDWFAC